MKSFSSGDNKNTKEFAQDAINDEELLAGLMSKSQAGDKTAYNQLLDRLYPILKGYLISRSPNFAEDIMQEILISIHNARHTYDPSRPFKPWLFAIAKRRMIDFQRSQVRENKRKDLYKADLKENSPEFGQDDANSELQEALSNLPDKQKQVVELLKLEGYSVEDVAGKLSLSTSNVKVIAHRAYEKLRSLLTEARSKEKDE